MLQGLVDNVLAVAKESVKTFTYESLNNFVRLLNGLSALVLAILPGKNTILEGIHGWELRPTLRGPRLPRWMENGVSSFNQFIHEFSVDSDESSGSDYASGEEDNGEHNFPGSPSSRASRFSRANSFSKYDRRSVSWIKRFFLWILWPMMFIIGIPFRIYRLSGFRMFTIDRHQKHQSSHLYATKKSNSIKNNVTQGTTDRRRGVIEDLQLAIEIFIESVFEIVHKGAHCLLSPSETCHIFFRWISSLHSRNKASCNSDQDSVSIPTATIGETDPTPKERQVKFHQSLNTDARTCRDLITELGYPYEAIRVVTSDGYVLFLERIPRRDSGKVVYLQHGLMDSSLGWVSNGVVGSPAFAAYDQGYDVFLGNLRGLVSREHVDPTISSRKYWRYSINEHGTQDIPAMIEKIHQVKTSELKKTVQPDSDDETSSGDHQPYKVCAISHSLGGAAMLMYVVTRRLENKSHRLSRLILLSPAGFHEDSNIVFTFVQYMVLILAPILAPLMPGLYIPTRFFRMLLNKLARDFNNYPALGGLVQTLMSYGVGGDSSNWVGVIGLPHYNMHDMPGVSFYVAVHLAQIKRAKKFMMYNFGSASSNMEAYGSTEPLDVGACYGLIDIPVNLVAGRNDGVIRPSMVRKHYKLMHEAGVEVSYNEFEYAHLDFTFSHREELLDYVMSRLLLVEPPTSRKSRQKVIRLKKSNKRRTTTEEEDAGSASSSSGEMIKENERGIGVK